MTPLLDLPQLDGALCADTDGAAWFPEDLGPRMHSATGQQHIADIKKICAACPVRLDCLAAGLHEPFGIWGGLTARERLRLRASECLAGVGQLRHASRGER